MVDWFRIFLYLNYTVLEQKQCIFVIHNDPFTDEMLETPLEPVNTTAAVKQEIAEGLDLLETRALS